MKSKFKYIELTPVKQILDFEDRDSWSKFFDKRISEILDYTFANNLNYKDYFKYQKFMLNKDGTPRKLNTSRHLQTPENREKQKKNWLIYVEKRKKETAQRNANKKIAEIDFKIGVLNNLKKDLMEELK